MTTGAAVGARALFLNYPVAGVASQNFFIKMNVSSNKVKILDEFFLENRYMYSNFFTEGIMQAFYYIWTYIYMFMKPPNSGMENGI